MMGQVETKQYLKWYHKLAYGSGDLAANCSYGIIGSFLMLYLTNIVGMNAGIVGTLMLAARLFDGVSDIFFGTLVDRTHSRMGKARPWMFWSQFGVSILLVMLFSIPALSSAAQYAFFFVVYVSLNGIFYTANNIAYASLTSLITRNPNERVQIGSIRFMFSLGTNLFIAYQTLGFVETFGGGAQGWRTVALIYAIVAVIVNSISCLAVKELPEEKDAAGEGTRKTNLVENFKYLLTNKYYLLILAVYLITYCSMSIMNTAGVYFCTYVLGDANTYGNFSMASMLPSVIGLMFVPVIVKKFGIYKTNLVGIGVSTIMAAIVVYAGYHKMITAMLIFIILKGLFSSPILGDLNAIISDAALYTFKKDGVHIDGTMFSCSSMGMKVGSGVGTAVAGWLLAWGNYDGAAAVQPDSALSVITLMYVLVPFLFLIAEFVVVSFLNVEKANKELESKKEHGHKYEENRY